MTKSYVHHVPSGSYRIEVSQPLTLQAYLGTCVGVSIYDKVAGVGGLLHLLLPEPPESDIYACPEKYAATGLPMFIGKLMEKGATRENMQAHVAGGALVVPVTHHDMELNIGGRTSDLVFELLEKEGIPIAQSETGGVFTCILDLYMKTGAVEIKPAGGWLGDEAPAETTRPTKDDIDRSISKTRPIPQIALKVLRLLNEDDYDIDDLTAEVKKDQVITAKVIKLCNSVALAGREKIDSIDHCLVIMGRNMLAKMVMNTCINGYFKSTRIGGYALCKGGLYHHALGTAIMAEKIAGMTGRVPPASAYTAGLLHDIGMVVLDQFLAAGNPLFYRMQKNEIGMLAAEADLLGTDHTRAGAMLAKKWRLPGSLFEVIAHHHSPEKAKANPELVHTVYLAELLMSRFQAGMEQEIISIANFKKRLSVIGLSFSKFYDIIDQIPMDNKNGLPEQKMEPA
ncbi:MAG: HDOD domain-containing protein [Thermodesulfobacteriota bacterium]|nr:HDOD domain-containing protein [Thermodesulfobacteriota bacterium]